MPPAAIIIRAVVQNKLHLQKPVEWDKPLLIYWLAMYTFCIAALGHLGIAAEKPLYFLAGVVFCTGTLLLGMIKKETLSHIKGNNSSGAEV